MSDRPNTVYRCYDISGRIIYIGKSSVIMQRQRQHSKKADWWHLVATEQFDHYATKDEMSRVEVELIKIYRPAFNKQHNDNWEAIRAAYLAIVAAEEVFGKVQAGTRANPLSPPSILSVACGQTDLYCQREEEEHCGYGEPIGEGSPYLGSDICGSLDCTRCHLYFHGMQEALPIGYDEGRKAESLTMASAQSQGSHSPNDEPRACGHCTYCTADEKDPWDACVALQWTVTCDICGRLDCEYRGAYQEGNIHGYDYAAESVKAATEGKLWDRTGDAYIAHLYLRMGTTPRSPAKTQLFAEWDAKRLDSIQALIQADREGRLDELTDAARPPF